MLPSFLRRLRESAGLTQTEMGAALGYRQTSVSNIEVGRQGIGATELALWLAAAKATDEQRLEAIRLAAALDLRPPSTEASTEIPS